MTNPSSRCGNYLTIFFREWQERMFDLEENYMDEKKLEGVQNWNDAERMIAQRLVESNDSLARSVVEQSKAATKKWFIAFLVTLAALVATNAAWLYVWQSYEYVSQDGTGLNAINTGTQENIDYGSKNEN